MSDSTAYICQESNIRQGQPGALGSLLLLLPLPLQQPLLGELVIGLLLLPVGRRPRTAQQLPPQTLRLQGQA